MKFGVQHGIGDPQWRPEVLDQRNITPWVRAAEESGWSGIAFTDHPAPSTKWANAGGEGSSEPFSSLAFCAALTEDITLITLVTVLPYRNPLFTAHQIRTLDRLSGGRLVVGVGTGYLRGEFRASGADFDRRRELFDEALEILTADTAVEEIAHRGIGFETSGTALRPPSIQRPHPPLWVHANSRWGLDRAARFGGGALLTLTTETLAGTIRTAHVPDSAAVGERIDRLRDATNAAGRDPAEVTVALGGVLSLLDVRQGWNVDQVRADIAEYESLGVDWLIFNVIGDDPAASEETVRRFGEEIILAKD
ncbi:oxidoreductase [Frankia torreyi]|uniref:Oxidoreductase n=1 Tax=Frankia torreyi TaxID=1856 RepID=A0A0D8BBI3_9ACTN|nr:MULTISPECIES: LLM class F420-dependent oxidoreductase [Frankia]KJE21643.1 oxidoreductase [Frankia torreyi]KQC36733.1 dehydrogenase [Frankia sp. ACN1ag]